MSNVIKRARLSESDITLLRTIFVSNKLAAGDPILYGQVDLSPPTTYLTPHCSDFSDLLTHTKLAYVTFVFGGSCG